MAPSIDYVEYHGPEERPHCVITEGYRWWDFEWSEIDQSIYYHESGSGRFSEVRLPEFVRPPDPPVKVYIRPGLRIETYHRGRLAVLHALAPIARFLPVLWRLYRVLADAPGLYREATEADFPRLGLLRIDAPLNDPFEDGINGEVVYCRFCDDWLPDERDEVCSHVWSGPNGLDGPGCDDSDAEEGAAFMAWASREEERVDAYDFRDWRHGAWAAWEARARQAKEGRP